MAGMVESPDGFLTQVVLLPVWQFLSASGDELDLLRGAQVALEAGRAALRAGHSQALRESGPQLQAWRSRSRSLARLRHQASSLAPAGADRFLSRAAAQESIRELVVTAIALERFRLSQGRPPEQLIDLVPRFLAAPPRDFGSGGAFRYRLLPEGRFLLYGVGSDGTDDGGQAESISKDHSLPNLTPLTTRDMVWPAACSPGEARAVRATLWEDPAAWAAR